MGSIVYPRVTRHNPYLRPHHKLDYFKSAKWDEKWIKTAKQIVRDEFERTYKGSGTADSTTFNAECDTGLKKVCPSVFSVCVINFAEPTMWRQRICAPKATDLRDEIDRYLSTDPEHTDNVLLWWAEWKKAYPCLSRMALDYLSIPGMYFILCYCCSSADFHL